MRRTVMVIAAAALAGCDGGGEPQGVKKIEVAGKGTFIEGLRSLSQQDRDLALRRAVQDGGRTCKRVKSSAETGTYENMVMWTVRCDDGKDWAVFIAPSGDAQVRSCGNAAELGLPRCQIS